MNSREATWVRRETEDEPTETERKGGDSAPCAQGRERRATELRTMGSNPTLQGKVITITRRLLTNPREGIILTEL